MFDYAMPTSSNAVIDAVKALGHRENVKLVSVRATTKCSIQSKLNAFNKLMKVQYFRSDTGRETNLFGGHFGNMICHHVVMYHETTGCVSFCTLFLIVEMNRTELKLRGKRFGVYVVEDFSPQIGINTTETIALPLVYSLRLSV